MPDNQFLSRWMNRRLTPEEEAEWKQSQDYRQWQKIQRAIEKRALPELDKEQMYDQLQTALTNHQKQGILRRLPLRVSIAIAATIALLLTFWLLLPEQQTWTTPYASKDKIELPDGSTAQLNADSRLSYTENITGSKRKLKLEGEAFFDVTPGRSFFVQTENGTIEVLGTQFNVLSRSNQFEVYCTEGKVAVTYNNSTVEIQAGQSIAPLKQQAPITHDHQIAPWINGSSEFQQALLPYVFKELERQYNVSVQYEGLSNRRYTGRFPHDSLEDALSLICGAMQLSFAFTDDKNIQISKQEN